MWPESDVRSASGVPTQERRPKPVGAVPIWVVLRDVERCLRVPAGRSQEPGNRTSQSEREN